MISLVSSSAKTSDFISPKDVKDQLLKTLRFTWKFCAKSIFVFSYELEDAYAVSGTHMRLQKCERKMF